MTNPQLVVVGMGRKSTQSRDAVGVLIGRSSTPEHWSTQSAMVSRSLSVSGFPQPQAPGVAFWGSSGQSSPHSPSAPSESLSPSQTVSGPRDCPPRSTQQSGSRCPQVPSVKQQACEAMQLAAEWKVPPSAAQPPSSDSRQEPSGGQQGTQGQVGVFHDLRLAARVEDEAGREPQGQRTIKDDSTTSGGPLSGRSVSVTKGATPR